MLIFLDTEFTDFIDCELISIGLVSEDGLHSLYLEVQDFDRMRCNAFVREAILPYLEQSENVSVSRAQISTRLRDWFSTSPANVTLAFDSQHDLDLLADLFDGDRPPNIYGWYDLRLLNDTGSFNAAVAHYHTTDRPWHHALYDAQANRAGWMSAMNNQAMGQQKIHVPIKQDASTAVVRKPKYSLEELLAQMPDGFPELTEEEKAWLDAPPLGKEIL